MGLFVTYKFNFIKVETHFHYAEAQFTVLSRHTWWEKALADPSDEGEGLPVEVKQCAVIGDMLRPTLLGSEKMEEDQLHTVGMDSFPCKLYYKEEVINGPQWKQEVFFFFFFQIGKYNAWALRITQERRDGWPSRYVGIQLNFGLSKPMKGREGQEGHICVADRP